MEDLAESLQIENKRFWDTYRHSNQTNGAALIAMSIRWAALVVAKEIREKGQK